MVAPTHTVVMTGAGRGLGWHAAVAILSREPRAHLVATSRGATTGRLAESLAGASGNPNVSEVGCDLASVAAVRDAALRIRQDSDDGDLPPITTVIANAGAQFTTTALASADGVEMTFAVNVLANFVLVDGLAPGMANPGRIVVTSSDTHFGDFRHTLAMVAGPQWRDPQLLCAPSRSGTAAQRSGQEAYSTSKLAVVYLVHALARRLPDGLDVYSFNPGLVPGTELARDRGALSRAAWRVVMPALTVTPLAMSARSAGSLLADAAVGPKPAPTGSYIDRYRATASSPASYDAEREEGLWQVLAAHAR